MEPKISKMEKEWRAESDVRALQTAAQIKGDKARMTAAQAYAKKLTAAVVQPSKPAAKVARKKSK